MYSQPAINHTYLYDPESGTSCTHLLCDVLPDCGGGGGDRITRGVSKSGLTVTAVRLS